MGSVMKTQLTVLLAAMSLLCAVEVYASEPESATLTEKPLDESDRDHWAWRPLEHAAVPAVADDAWCSNPIDRFILAKLESIKLAPQPLADRLTLLRRVTLDLTGLVPTPSDVDAFLADDSPQAYERAVDRLLASPAYGERYAQHWLDLARYAETDGFEHDKLRPQAWKYRDWVIDALNRDMPYDEFIRLQIAGDELKPDEPAAAIATGFCLCGPDMPDINLQNERRHFVLNELTSTVGSALLGLQIGCAQCHDHKYDPLSQADFYRLRAIFEPGVPLKDTPHGRTLRETSSTAPSSYLWVRGDFRRQGPEVSPDFPRIAKLTSVSLPSAPEGAKSTGRRTALAQWLTTPDHPLTTRVIVNRLWQFHFGHGMSTTPSDVGVVGDPPSHPELLDWLATELVRQGWSLKAMHKLMVMSATYRQASRPASPEWSPTQTATARANWNASRTIDRENRFLSHMNRRRLEGEAIRDCMLAAADRLSPRRGGPGVMTPLAKELLATTVSAKWEPAEDEQDHRRRSIYLMVRRNLRYPLFEAFDAPDTINSCPERNRSTTAPQALLLLNSEMSLALARDFAGYLLKQASDEEARVTLAYRRVLSRLPSAAEGELGLKFLQRQAAAVRSSDLKPADLALPESLPQNVAPAEAAALVQFCLAMFNLNEFVYID